LCRPNGRALVAVLDVTWRTLETGELGAAFERLRDGLKHLLPSA
jgi:hypothetical protein